MKNILLGNALYLDIKTGDLIKADIEVERGSRGGLIFHNKGARDRGNYRFIDCSGKIVTRSFINSHHHIYSALARGMPAPEIEPVTFPEILKFIWWKLDRLLTREMIEVSAAISAIESLKCGVTYIIDHHSSPNSIMGSLEIISRILNDCGIDSIVCYEMSDRDGGKKREEGLRETEAFLESGNMGLVGLHASFTVSDILMKEAVKLAERYDSGIHIHLSESEDDNLISMNKFKERAAQRLYHYGVLNFPKTLLAHAIHINERERKLIAGSNAFVVRNPRSNLNNGVGLFKDSLLEEKILIGTDGMDSNVLSDVKQHYLVKAGGDPGTPENSFKCLDRAGRYLEKNGFTPHGNNDFLILDYKSPTGINRDNIYSHFIYGIRPSHIEYVVSDGEIVVDRCKVVSIDEEVVYKESVKLAGYLWKRMKSVQTR